ncbi:hypothetical protein FB567DRAFT_540228 [Paraphoma chrysanthemicola]|uniref:Uncharacterized protein n=1 Tax=Paraphoma chrysanthemicola TaxID=798071 RepID=A0A8K0QSH6_9PLEO|nr:hypothetical protein FB567DRAFT_540228 [Paraphoma chrysanthemicola]
MAVSLGGVMNPYPSKSSDEDIVAYTTSSIWSEFEADFSQTYSQDWSPTYNFDHCPCCSLRPIDDLIAEAQEVSQFPSRCYTTSEYSGFRASTRAQQRKRKIRENNGGCNSYRCRKMEQAQQDIRNLKRKREALKWAIRESQIKTPCLAAKSGRRTRHCLVTWDMSVEEELDDSKRQTETTTYDHAETLAKEEPSVDPDENLGEWCMVSSADATVVSELNLHHRETDTPGLVVSEQGDSQKRLWQIIARLYTCNTMIERESMTHKVTREDVRIYEGEQDVVSTRREIQDGWDLVSVASVEV